jgi:virginiamycin B lyase
MRIGRLAWWRRAPRLSGAVAVLVGVPLLTLGLAAGAASAAASGAGSVTIYPGIGDPVSITAGPDGALWFADTNSSIGRITTTGTVRLFHGPGIDEPDGITAGPDGALWFTNAGDSSIGRITTAVTPAISGFTPATAAGTATSHTSFTVT